MTQHAKLSASGSHRWIICPGSIKAEEGFPNTTNKYAEEGVLAHAYAESLLTGKEFQSDVEISDEMQDAVRKYKDYIQSLHSREKCYSHMFFEQKVDYSHIASEGFGTVDAIIYFPAIKTLHIIDFKYGIGKIEARDNSQLILYALGAFKFLNAEVSNIHLHIVQPRIENYDTWSINNLDLNKWANYLKERAEIALDSNAPRIPSEAACKYCRANATCPALNKIASVVDTLSTTDRITEEETKFILDNSKLVINFINKVEEDVYNRLACGNKFPGYKLVQGRNMRKIIPSKESLLVEILGENAYNKTLLGIGQLEKLVDKETLNSLVSTFICSPILTKENDKRSAIDLDEFKFDPI